MVIESFISMTGSLYSIPDVTPCYISGDENTQITKQTHVHTVTLFCREIANDQGFEDS
jgi:hypothetical protein